MNPIPAILITGFFVWLFIDFIKTKKHPQDKDPEEDDTTRFYNN